MPQRVSFANAWIAGTASLFGAVAPLPYPRQDEPRPLESVGIAGDFAAAIAKVVPAEVVAEARAATAEPRQMSLFEP